jgi:putative ubiquitin-RnfH superfamily antitoxin RatB of RatAB toxin-antitoxin module
MPKPDLLNINNVNVEVVLVDDIRQQKVISLKVKQGATVLEALQAAGVPVQILEKDDLAKRVGIFGKFVSLDRLLKEDDRVEIYQDLLIDPKEARRKKAKAQRASSSKR